MENKYLTTASATNNETDVITYGKKSTGIVAQSLGGGGGNGGFNVSAGASGGGAGAFAISVGLGGKGESGGSGGDVTTNLKSNVSTHGEESKAVFVQSLGGGGGNGGFNVSAFGTGAGIGSGGLTVGLGGEGAGGGKGGDVDATYQGQISTKGKNQAASLHSHSAVVVAQEALMSLLQEVVLEQAVAQSK